MKPAELHRVQTELRGELVHLRLVGEARLYGSEAAHRAARRVVGVERQGLDVDVLDDVGADGERRGVADDGRGRGGIRSAVQHDPALEVRELAVLGGPVLVPELGGVAVDMPEEGLEAVVDDLYGLAGAQREEARVDLHRQVLTAAEGTADTGERHPDLVLGQAEYGRDLAQIRVQPLRGDVQVDAAVLARHGEAGLRAEERLVLHAEDVLAGDDHIRALRGLRGVAAHDGLAVHDVRVRYVPRVVVVAVLVDQRRALGGGGRLVRDDRQVRVVDTDLGGGAARGLGVVGGDDRDGLAVVADLAVGEDGGVLELQAVALHLRRQVVVGEDRVNAGSGQRLGGVDGPDLGVRDGAAQGVAPEHVLVPHVGGVRELAGDLEGAVGAQGGLADAALGAGALGDVGRGVEAGVRFAMVRPPLPGVPGGPRRGGPRRGSSRSRCSGRGCRTGPRGCPRRTARGCVPASRRR